MNLESIDGFRNFISDFFFKIPDLYLMKNFLDIFTDSLELDESILEPLIKSQSPENSIKKFQSKKRVFSEVENKDSSDINLASKKRKLTTIDSFFNKEIGFRNVKERIEGSHPTRTNANLNFISMKANLDEINEGHNNIPLNNWVENDLNKNNNLFESTKDDKNEKLIFSLSQHYETQSTKSCVINTDTQCLTNLTFINAKSTNMNSNTPCHNNFSEMTNSQTVALRKDYNMVLNENLSNFTSLKNKNQNVSTNYSELLNNLCNKNKEMLAKGKKNNQLTENNTMLFSQQSCKSATSNRSHSGMNSHRGINSRLAGSTMGFIAMKKQKSVRKKTNLKIVDKLMDQFNKEEKEKQERVENTSENSQEKKPFINMINKGFYAKSREISSPSPISSHIPRYSKRKPEESQEKSIKNNPKEYNNFSLLKTKNLNYKDHTYECKEDNIISDTLKNPHVIVINRTPINGIKSKSERKYSKSSIVSSDEDEILVRSTPTKVAENLKFKKKPPSSRTNLMNLFHQMHSSGN